MQTLTFVCRQDFRIWIMHCYSWIGPYRDTAACVCSAQCVFRTHCKCSFSACQCISPWLRLLRDCFVCVKVKLKGQFTQHWQLKKPCRHLHENIASLLCCTFWHFIYTQTRFWVTEGEDFSKLQGKDSVLTRWRKKGGGRISTSGWVPSSYLFDMRLWDMSVLFTWGNILQWLGQAKYWCFNAAIWAFVVFSYTHVGSETEALTHELWWCHLFWDNTGYRSCIQAEECVVLISLAKPTVNLWG